MRAKLIPIVVSLLFLFSHGVLAVQEAALAKVETYDQLVSAIRAVQNTSRERIEQVVEQERVREAWETGKLIDEHILLNQPRAEYGKQVIERLASDLRSSAAELRFMLQFARAYPIRSPASELSWAHYRELLSLNDPKEREEVTKEAIKKGWNRDQVRAEVQRRKAASSSLSSDELAGGIPLPEITPGPLHTYQIIRLKDSLKIDLGFGIYHDLPEKETKKSEEGDIVSLEKGRLKKIDVKPAQLFTYQAQVTQVVDGDTFHALIDLGFGDTFAQRVRLRRIDAPEIVSAEGKEAKVYLEKILSQNKGRILMQSIDIDQHGRPIADVWCKGKPIDQELLDKGYAVRIPGVPGSNET